MSVFTNPADPENISLKIKIKEWLVAGQLINFTDKINIVEIKHCTEPHCSDFATIISIFDTDGSKTEFQIRKPLVFVRKWDIDALAVQIKH